MAIKVRPEGRAEITLARQNERKNNFLSFLFSLIRNFAKKLQSMVKKIAIVCLTALLFAACQETMDERCAREAREYTEKNCPTLVAEGVTIDSLVFNQPTRTLTYNYSLEGKIDSAEILQQNDMKEMLLKELKNSTNMKAYKEAGYNIRYVYHSTKHAGKKLFEVTFHEKDYR